MTSNDLNNLCIIADTLLHLTSYYMEEVLTPFRGFRLRPQYTRLISTNPANQGKLFKDPNGRPSGAVYAALYLCTSHPSYYYGKEKLSLALYILHNTNPIYFS